jgi:excinuclease ABC subunit A
VKKHQVSDVVDYIYTFPEGTRGCILTDIFPPEGRTIKQQLETLKMQGFSRVELNGEFERLEDIIEIKINLNKLRKHLLVVDRFSGYEKIPAADLELRTDSFLRAKALAKYKYSTQ